MQRAHSHGVVLTEAVSGVLISIFHRNEATNISHFHTSSMSITRPPSSRLAAETARGSGSLTVVSYAAVVRSEEIVRRLTPLARWDSTLTERAKDLQAEQRPIPGGDLRLGDDIQLLAEVGHAGRRRAQPCSNLR